MKKNFNTQAEQVAYQQSLPKKRMGSGALFLDENGRILLVEPGYKPVWEIPGGVVELNESPKSCCQREVAEELGLEIEIGKLLLVEYNAPAKEKTESLMFIFDGGTLPKNMINDIRLQKGELLSFRFFPPEQLPQNLTPTLRSRILSAYLRLSGGHDSYQES